MTSVTYALSRGAPLPWRFCLFIFLAVLGLTGAAAAAPADKSAPEQSTVTGFGGHGHRHKSPFVQVDRGGTGFVLQGKPYHYIGTNYWQAMNLASRGPGGNRPQLLRELDALKASGITNLRILAGSEGPNTEPLRVVPALLKAPGVYDHDLLDGLDFLLYALRQRDMKAVMVLGNEWHWSGGFGQYLVWAGVADSVPYPPPREGGNWDEYQRFVAQFYGNDKAVGIYLRHAAKMITRYNRYTRTRYRDEPAIMSWQLANEPRAIAQVDAYHQWIERSTSVIKHLDRNHLVTVGSEGDTPFVNYTGTEYVATHSHPNVDYGTAHVWVQNWGWYNPERPETYGPALVNAKAYIDSQVAKAVQTGKPIVFEEFGIARDAGSFDPAASVTVRDQYYGDIFQHLLDHAKQGPVAGANFWAWAGESRPLAPYGQWWYPGDPLLGDPPHELQGWYSIYNTDASTLAVIRKYSDLMKALPNPRPTAE